MSYSLLHTIRRKSEFTISFTSLQTAVSAKKEKDIIWRSPTPSPHPQNFCWHFYMAQTNIIFPPVIKCILFKFKSLTLRSCKNTHKENSERIYKPVTPQTPNTTVRSKTAASTNSNQTEKKDHVYVLDLGRGRGCLVLAINYFHSDVHHWLHIPFIFFIFFIR